MPDSDDAASAVARLSVLCGLVMAPISLLLVHLSKHWLASWTGLKHTPWVLYLIPLSLIISTFLTVANNAAIRQGLYAAKARAYVGSTLLTNLGKLVVGLLAPSGLLLIALSLAGGMLNIQMQLFRVPRHGVLKVHNWFGVRGVRRAAHEQRDFALYRLPQSIIRASSMGIPIIALTALFGPGPAGQYSLTVLILSAPVMLLGDAVGEVFYPKITHAITSQSASAGTLIIKATIVLTLAGVIPFGPIVLFGDRLMPELFGTEWRRAGEFSQWIGLWMAAMLISRPAVTAIPALGMQKSLLKYEVLITIARIAALYVGAEFGDDLSSVIVFSLTNIAGYAALLTMVSLRILNRKKGSKLD